DCKANGASAQVGGAGKINGPVLRLCDFVARHAARGVEQQENVMHRLLELNLLRSKRGFQAQTTFRIQPEQCHMTSSRGPQRTVSLVFCFRATARSRARTRRALNPKATPLRGPASLPV